LPREVGRAVDRVDDPAGAGQAIHHRSIRMHRFFADNGGFVVQLGQPFRQRDLSLAVGDGDEIVVGLLDDFGGLQRPVARHDDAFGNIAHQRQNFAVEYAHGFLLKSGNPR